MNNQLPVPDPLTKDYEYFFPSASWDKNGITPLYTEENNSYTMKDIDIKIPEQ